MPTPPAQPPHSPETGTTPRRSWRARLAGMLAQPDGFASRALRFLGFALLAACLIALIGLLQRLPWGSEPTAESETVASEERLTVATPFTCPMHPQIRQPEPGNCPICGMRLVPLEESRETAEAAFSHNAIRRLGNIQTATAKAGPLTEVIRSIGEIEVDESRVATLSADVAGRLEELYADYVGVPVSEGDDLALIYSPQLYSAQVEYLTALNSDGLNRLGGGERFLELAEQNLLELGLSEDQVDELQQRRQATRRVRIRSPLTGTVIAKHAVEGDYLQRGEAIYRIADLATVWLMLELPPQQAARLRFGQQVEAEVQGLPEAVLIGRVGFIGPTVAAETRTVPVRVELLNPDGQLRPGDLAHARLEIATTPREQLYDPDLAGKYISPMHPQVIRDAPGRCPLCDMELIPTSQLGFSETPMPDPPVISVPRDAILLAGDAHAVFVESSPGEFVLRRVAIGPLAEERAVILEGLTREETVARHGNFLIDSQVGLTAGLTVIDPHRRARSER